MTLIIRKKRDGSTTIDGDMPEKHVFSARWIERELGELVDVTITVKTSDQTKEYKFTGFEEIETPEGEDNRSNFTGWKAEEVKPRRRSG